MNEDEIKPQDEIEADGYYGDDEAETEELDLAFLDEDEEDDDKAVK
jgi:hypothetical protein